MKYVYQKVKDPIRGDCMKCCICSILDLNYDEFPDPFKNGPLGAWMSIDNSLRDLGYKLTHTLYNPMICELYEPTRYCFKIRPEDKYDDLEYITELPKYDGVNNLYIGIVLSPRYFRSYDDLELATHAVVINEFCNIIHDPNSDYIDIKEYPLAKVLSYNGITKVYIIEKIEN